jgi:serine/threonine-protein kinase
MTAPAGRVLYRICPMCDVEIAADFTGAKCGTCGTKLVEIRAERDELIGAVIDDRFEIRDQLGKGGMGTVYRAWQRSVGREVAVKLMDRNYSSEPMSVRRFLREARLASQLSQPNTVSVFDFGQAADGRLFIAMELCRGRTLHAVLTAEVRFSLERAVRVGTQICDALEAAHALGIVHRDLKLENVMVLDHPPGRDLVKVLDFGLAKNMREPGSRATESGIVVGTPRYMAPEAAMTGKSGPPADLYALGVILGELASGKAMWEGDSLPHLVAQKLDPTPAVALVPEPMRSIVAALIDPEPERRPTAPEARALLAGALEEPDAGATVRDAPTGRETLQLRPQRGAQATPHGADATPHAAAQPALTPAATPHAAAVTPSRLPKLAGAAPTPIDHSPSMSELAVAPRRRRWLLLALMIGAALGGAGVVALLLEMRGGGAPAPARDAAAAPVVHAPDATLAAPRDAVASDKVALHVTSVPEGAEVIDPDAHAHVAPFDLAVAAGTPIKLRASLAGYHPRTILVTPEGDHPTVKIILERVEAVRPPPREDPNGKPPF